MRCTLAAKGGSDMKGLKLHDRSGAFGAFGWLVVGVFLLTGRLACQDREKAPQANYNWYQCKDGQYIAILGVSPDEEIFWQRFCKAIERPDLSADSKFSSAVGREKNHVELIRILDAVFVQDAGFEQLGA